MRTVHNHLMFKVIFTFLLSFPNFCFSALSDNIIISSEVLNYDLQYRIYLPDNVDSDIHLPTIYVTDGEWYLSKLHMPRVLDRLINNGAIRPLKVVFVDSRSPHDIKQNRRNSQFMCNKDYALFFVKELIPRIEKSSATPSENAKRLILGLSFGGINAACFGLMLPEVFTNIAMFSPAGDKKVALISQLYQEQEKLPLKIFLSIGNKEDSALSVRKLRRTLQDKGYELTYKEVPFSHEWDNWRRLIDDVLLTFYANK